MYKKIISSYIDPCVSYPIANAALWKSQEGWLFWELLISDYFLANNTEFFCLNIFSVLSDSDIIKIILT